LARIKAAIRIAKAFRVYISGKPFFIAVPLNRSPYKDSGNLPADYYLIFIQRSLAGPGPGFFHWVGISEVR
jgi:hypothetical protein